MVKVLVQFPHGLGDTAQFTVVLKHIRRYRPEFEIDLVVGRGKHTIYGPELCHAVYHESMSWPSGPYDTVKGVGFYENYDGYHDRPGSKVTNCLKHEFGLDKWDADLGRYSCQRRPPAMEKAASYLASIGCKRNSHGRYNALLLHFKGNTSEQKKNLDQWQAEEVVRLAQRAGRIPVVLDWDRRNTLVDQATVFCPEPGPNDIWGGFGSGDAEVLACLIQQAEAFIGIDSGPLHVAASTETPTLGVWRGHHPIQFFDPAENTTHLIPASHRSLPPCCDHPKQADFFTKHYLWRTYEGEHGLAAEACRWLGEVLGVADAGQVKPPPSFLLPNGIGDTMWALTKIRSVAAANGRPADAVEITLAGNSGREVDRRSVPFLKRFPFVKDVRVSDISILEDKESPTDARGRYRYRPDGPLGNYHVLAPNKALEEGRRLEDWLPEYPTDWGVIDEFDWSGTERGWRIAKAIEPFAAVYLGPEAGHCDEGHNRGWLWEPKHWIELCRALKEEHGLNVAVVGAEYDRSFYERYVKEGLEKEGQRWVDLIGRLEIGETFRLLRESRLMVSYQCGLAIVLHYLGGKVVSWWRPDGDSCHGSRKVCFDNRMKDSWQRPGWEHNWLGCLYRKETVADILDEIEKRGWLE